MNGSNTLDFVFELKNKFLKIGGNYTLVGAEMGNFPVDKKAKFAVWASTRAYCYLTYSGIRVILAIKIPKKLENYPNRHKLPGHKLRVP